MREKLIELIHGANDKVLSVPYISYAGAEALADYLIANGVTVLPTHLKNIEPTKYKIYDMGKWGSVSLIDGHIDE